MISIGGWTHSGQFSKIARTSESRLKFARSAVNFALEWGFDGVDINWVYPVAGGMGGNIRDPSDKENFTLLLKKIRDLFDLETAANGKKYLLSIATTANY